MNSNYYGIILAGGVGSRFWPVSKSSFPKQFHDMLGSGNTLIQNTYNRLTQLIPKENILVLTNEKYNALVLKQLPQLKKEQVVSEPAMRNTAPSILYAALKIQKLNPEALTIVAPSDHWIEDESAFNKNIKEAFNFSSANDALLTLGIPPTFPNTGYGYIEFNTSSKNPIKPVVQFREKPDYKTAKLFLERGNFLWNSGIFIWSVRSIIKAFKAHQNDLFSLFKNGDDVYNTNDELKFINNNYHLSENISIDYAIMEPSNNVFVLPVEFDWNDLGTWGSLYNKLEKDSNGNAIINASSQIENSTGNMIRTQDGKIVVIDDLHDFIVVDQDNILLIMPKNKEQDIKQKLEKVKASFGADNS